MQQSPPAYRTTPSKRLLSVGNGWLSSSPWRQADAGHPGLERNRVGRHLCAVALEPAHVLQQRLQVSQVLVAGISSLRIKCIGAVCC